ncbi:MAG: hypothetical protein Q9191_006380 [Dirinaria sp. TL-2023a]
MRLRVRGPAGQSTLTLEQNATVGDLQSNIAKLTSITSPDIKYGYPPKPLHLENYEKTASLSGLGVKLDGEQLIVSQRVAPVKQSSQENNKIPNQPSGVPIVSSASEQPRKTSTAKSVSSSFSFADVGVAPPSPPPNKPANAAPSSQSSNLSPLSLSRKPNKLDTEPPELPLPTHAATLLLRIMPDDNSCLFRAFNSAYFGAMDNMHELRSIIAQYIQGRPEDYSAAVLDKEPDAYCRWIQREDAWGGFIELDILSKHFDVEICSIDVQTLRVDRFNEGRPKRCILVYSGIHYDVIALSPSDPPYTSTYAPPDFDTKIFEADDDIVLDRARELCKILQGQHYFTNTASFSIRCNVCGAMLVGEKGATEHASTTGHYDFGEAL